MLSLTNSYNIFSTKEQTKKQGMKSQNNSLVGMERVVCTSDRKRVASLSEKDWFSFAKKGLKPLPPVPGVQ